MPKKNQKLPGRNPSDPMLLAMAVVEAAIGEPLAAPKPKTRQTKRKGK